jgi:DNA-binding NarL/FixJ family response regulator
MDVRMKRLDGITATKDLLRSYPDANVVVLTQYQDPMYRDAAMNAGAKAYLSKDDIGSLTSLITMITHDQLGGVR